MHPMPLRRGLSLAASILGLLVLSFGLAPGTVLASSPTDIYTEGPPPGTPPPTKKPFKKKPGNQKKPGKKKPGNQNNGNGDDSASTGAVVPTDGSGNTPGGSASSGNDGNQVPVDASGAGQSDGSSPTAAGNEDETLAVTPASESKSDGGGSALPLIIAILVGVPVLGLGGYFLWVRYRRRHDDDFHDLNSAYSGE